MVITTQNNVINFEDEQLNYKFFSWLFDSVKINLDFEYDFIPNSSKENSSLHKIFYTDELKSFFETQPMQRLKRILQLGKFIDNDSNVLHTRYEHSLGTYNHKKNMILSIYLNDSTFREYVENNDLKIYLVAELIKSAGHDIGHLPLSHVLELSIIGKHGFHEEIGKKILQENKEVLNCLSSISTKLPEALNHVLHNDVFGFRLLDEGNYDLDRFDYIYRDLAYRGQPKTANFEPFKLVHVKSHILNGMHVPIVNEDNSVVLTDFNNTADAMIIPVFNINSIGTIEDFQNLRIKCYQESYFHSITNIRDKSVSLVIRQAIRKHEPYGKQLQDFLIHLKSIHHVSELDINSFLYWDDLTFFDQLLDIAEFSKDKSLQAGARFIVPHLEELFDISVKMLGLKNRTNSLSSFDGAFLKRLHRYLVTKTDLTQDLSDYSYWDKCILYTANPDKIKQLQKESSLPIVYCNQLISGYKPSEPIYFETENGQVFPYDKIPNYTAKVSSSPIVQQVAFCFLPFVDKKHYNLNDLRMKFDSPKIPSFGTPYLNRPSPSAMYIKHSYEETER